MKKILSALSFAILASACASSSEPVATGSAAVSSADATPPQTASYVAICGFSLTGYDPTETLRFFVDSSFAPDVSSGQLTLALTMLPGWSDQTNAAQAPAVVTRAEAVGATLTATSDVADGKYTAALGSLDIPAIANSLNGVDGHVDGLQLDGTFTAPGAAFCANVSGELTTPLDFQLDQAGTTCLFVPVADGDPLPAVQSSDFHCP